MSKVICEICGTSYPDTARQCPICGCSRDMGGHLTADIYDSREGPEEIRTTRVKGGRFSTANVKKRNLRYDYEEYDTPDEYDPEYEQAPRAQGKGLAWTLVILIAILLSITIYLFVKVFLPNVIDPAQEQTQPQTTLTTEAESSEETTEETQIPTVPCTELTLESDLVIELEVSGQYYLIHTAVLPQDTTDIVSYVSENESVATVDSDGRVTAVGEGITTITVSCGEQSIECMVVCEFTDTQESTAETDPETSESETQQETQTETKTQSDVTIAFVKNDLTFNGIGVKYTLKYTPEDIPAEDIVWTSGNNLIASVENGVVHVKSWGITSVYAEYNGVKIECVIRAIKDET